MVGALHLEAVGTVHVDGRRKANGVDGRGHVRITREVPHNVGLVGVPVDLVEQRVPPGVVVRGATQVGHHKAILCARRGRLGRVDQAALDVAKARIRRGVKGHEEVMVLRELIVYGLGRLVDRLGTGPIGTREDPRLGAHVVAALLEAVGGGNVRLAVPLHGVALVVQRGLGVALGAARVLGV